MIVGHVYFALCDLPEEMRLEIKMVPGPSILQDHEISSQIGAHVAETGLKPALGFLLAEIMRNVDDDGTGHGAVSKPLRSSLDIGTGGAGSQNRIVSRC